MISTMLEYILLFIGWFLMSSFIIGTFVRFFRSTNNKYKNNKIGYYKNRIYQLQVEYKIDKPVMHEMYFSLYPDREHCNYPTQFIFQYMNLEELKNLYNLIYENYDPIARNNKIDELLK